MRRIYINILTERVSFRSGALLSLSALGALSPFVLGAAGVAAFAAAPAVAYQGSAPDAATRVAMEKRANARALLSSALTRIAANGNNAAALADAGRASMALDDYRSALGFLLRAEQNAPRDGAIKAALGTAMLHQENPRRALDYFGEAQLLRTPERLFIADRALAYDLLGQQDAAQRDYALAMTQNRDDEILRRYALSLGISGQADRAIEILTPLLNQQDRSAWRMRAMILAMNSRQTEAKQIVDATMPPELATNIWPYLEQMDRLTPAQIAEAAHFGRFPSGPLGPKRAITQMAAAAPAAQAAAPATSSRNTRGSRQSGRNERQVAQVAAAAPQVATSRVTAAPPPLPTPVVEAPVQAQARQRPLTGTAALNARQAEQAQKMAQLAAQNSRAAAQSGAPQAAAQPVAPVAPAPVAASPVAAAPVAARPQSAPSPASQISTVRDTTAASASANAGRSRVESIVAAQTSNRSSAATAPVSATAPVPVAAAPSNIAATPPSAVAAVPDGAKPLAAMASLGDIIGSLQIPAAELVRSDEAVSADALVQLREERRRAEAAAAAERAAKARADAAKARADAAAKAKADAEAKAKAEAAAKKREEEAKLRANPSRLWVQIGSGSNAGALSFTFDRYAKKHDAMFKGQKGATADWGRTRRLLVGPFSNRAAAQKFLDDFKKAEGDGFIFTSARGEEVEPLR